jgi:hypothetical protein
MAATMKNSVFLDMVLYRSCVNRRSSETAVHARSTRHHIQEDGILSPLIIIKFIKGKVPQRTHESNFIISLLKHSKYVPKLE